MAICEFWWSNNFVDRECMVVHLVPLLVASALDESAQKSNVKRLFQMRGALEVLDWEDEASRDTRDLLLRTVSVPLFLRMPEGKRFIAFLFHLHETLVADLHQAIRVQIPDTKKTILEAYGEIYLRCWEEAEELPELRKAIEETALQDLMYAIIHVGSPAMVTNLQTVLSSFHDAKKTPGVERLLNRLYGPILWRSLSAANPRVRVNAALVLTETFPLQDGLMAQTDKAVQKGVLALKNLLKDSDPRVRVAGSEATARVLATFWDVLPTSNIRTLLNRKYAQSHQVMIRLLLVKSN
jgi:condensin-2 complex subunit G2